MPNIASLGEHVNPSVLVVMINCNGYWAVSAHKYTNSQFNF